MASMRHLVETVSDYEFLRRFLTADLIFKFHLNRVSHRDMVRLGVSKKEVMKEDEHWVWLDPEMVKVEMLKFYTHFYRPRIYIIDTDFEDGGLLLFHRNDGRRLMTSWIKPTLKNLNQIWKGGVTLVSRTGLFGYSGGKYKEMPIPEITFEMVLDRMKQGKKPLRLE